MKTDDDLEILIKVLPPNVKLWKVERGIAVGLINQPAIESVVEMPADVKDRVWECLHNPKIAEDAKEWAELRKPVIWVWLEIARVVFQYGSPLECEVLKRGVEEAYKGHFSRF